MRRISLVACMIGAAVFMALAVAASGVCELTVRNGSGSTVGRIDADGTIRDASGSSIGSFRDGEVRGRSGSRIGQVEQDGAVRNASGSRVGNIEQDGTLRDASGSRIGSVEQDGTIRNKSGSRSGGFDGYVPACRLVAAAYLFFFEPLLGP